MLMGEEEARARLIGPGLPFEIEEVAIRGVPTRVWKNAPASLRAVFLAAEAYGEREFIVYRDERWSFARHNAAVRRLAHRLVAHYGILPGDRIAIAMRNLPEWCIAFWAATSIGAIAVPLNGWWTGEELEYGLADSGAVLAVLDHERWLRIVPHLSALDLRGFIVARATEPLAAPAETWDEVLAAAPEEAALPEADIAPEDDATIFYTSGTTGFPKGAVGSHRNICSNLFSTGFAGALRLLRQGGLPAALGGEPVVSSALLSVPLFHATGCHSTMLPLFAGGGKLVLMYRWDPEQAIALIEAEAVTGFGGVPGMVWQVLESPSFHDGLLKSVQGIGYGGAPSAPELVRRIDRGFPGAEPRNGYGLTETSSITTLIGGADYRARPDSVGRPVPVCEVKVVDGEGESLPPGGIGELWIKGPNVVRGYWGKPEATAETFSDGWLHSGDIGRMDAEGFVYILDRAKDMLIRGGENVYCVEVEDALYSHPGVMDAAVIGRPHHILGEEVVAVVQAAPGVEVSEDELIAHCRAHIASFKVPVTVEIRSEPLPRNANGKILKPQLKNELFG